MEIQVDSDGNPILDQFSAEGFVDLTFRQSSSSAETSKPTALPLRFKHRARLLKGAEESCSWG
jgi:hypothetical protein